MCASTHTIISILYFYMTKRDREEFSLDANTSSTSRPNTILRGEGGLQLLQLPKTTSSERDTTAIINKSKDSNHHPNTVVEPSSSLASGYSACSSSTISSSSEEGSVLFSASNTPSSSRGGHTGRYHEEDEEDRLVTFPELLLENIVDTRDPNHHHQQQHNFSTNMADTSIEAQLDRLNVDADLKASILAMDPESQRDTLNDIVRNRNMERMQQMFSMLGDAGTPAAPSSPDAEDSEEEDASDETPQLRGSRNGSPLTGMGMLDLLPFLMRSVAPAAGEGGTSNSARGMAQRAALFSQLREQLMMMLHSSHEQQEALERMGIDKDIDDMTYEELLELEERMGSVSKGLSDERASEVLQDVPSVTAGDGSCAICLDQLLCETLEDGQLRVSRIRNCDHMFHEKCIKGWLKENKICPICKKEVLLPAAPPASSKLEAAGRGTGTKVKVRRRGRGGAQ